MKPSAQKEQRVVRLYSSSTGASSAAAADDGDRRTHLLLSYVYNSALLVYSEAGRLCDAAEPCVSKRQVANYTQEKPAEPVGD